MFDGVEKTGYFTYPIITDPACTISSIINWKLESMEGASSTLSQYIVQWIKVTISGPNSSISVKALPGGESFAGTYPLTAKGYLPDGTTTEFSFDLDVGCDNPTITAPSSYETVKTATLGDPID